tara:strand:+ start:517 stop:669 length:153 start_codon:yes stop_codon:yes gene_type:complete
MPRQIDIVVSELEKQKEEMELLRKKLLKIEMILNNITDKEDVVEKGWVFW